jgi:hypothetical protein
MSLDGLAHRETCPPKRAQHVSKYVRCVVFRFKSAGRGLRGPRRCLKHVTTKHMQPSARRAEARRAPGPTHVSCFLRCMMHPPGFPEGPQARPIKSGSNTIEHRIICRTDQRGSGTSDSNRHMAKFPSNPQTAPPENMFASGAHRLPSSLLRFRGQAVARTTSAQPTCPSLDVTEICFQYPRDRDSMICETVCR